MKEKRYVPHEHTCPICGSTLGCENPNCPTGAYELCEAAFCHELSARGTVHAHPQGGSQQMPCCGHTPVETPRGDRMTIDQSKVTCTGPPEASARPASRRNPKAGELTA